MRFLCLYVYIFILAVDGIQFHQKDGETFRPLAMSTTNPPTPSPSMQSIPLQINGIFPHLAVTAESAPRRSECGVGALMPWADRLYMVTYLSVPHAGAGTGLYEITPDFTMNTLANHNSTYANRLLHAPSNQIVIGAWVIDADRNVRAFKDLLQVRIGGMAMHLTDPDHKVYMLGMDGPLWECNVYLLNCTQIFDLVETLKIPKDQGEQPHFKAAHTMNGRLVVASNTFEEADFLKQQHGGRLAEWEGPGHDWKVLEQTAFVEVAGRGNFGRVIYAVGWDTASVILKVYDGGDSSAPSSLRGWQTYRLPKASHAYDHLWQTEWPRIREVETERYLLDVHGQFYELSPLGWAGSTWGLRPVCRHLRMIPDFTSFRGLFVLGGNEVSSIFDNNLVTGQSQSGLYFGKTDDLWSFGKPQGWGGPWRYTQVNASEPSDPYLMTGFDKKTLHLSLHEGPRAVSVTVQIDFTGIAGHVGEPWNNYTTLELTDRVSYVYHVFPDGFSAHWLRVVANQSCVATAYLHYT